MRQLRNIRVKLLLAACFFLPNLTAAQCDVPTVSGNQILCNGQTLTLTAQAGYAGYVWSNGSNTASTDITTPGTYQVTVTCANGSTAVANVGVTGFTTGVQVAGNGTICSGQCVNLSVLLTGGSDGPYTVVLGLSTGGTATYTVNPTGGFGFVFISVCPLQTTTYMVQSVTNALGCSAFINPSLAATTVNVVGAGSLSILGPTSLCAGQTATLTAQPNNYADYLWSNGNTGSTITVNSPGTYSVTATLAGGCTASATTTLQAITANPPNITGGTALCPGSTLTLTATGGPYASYNWSNGGTTESITVTSTGIYTVTVTDANGCTATDSQVVNPGSSVSTSILGPTSLCPGATANLIATGSFASYQWSNGLTGSIISINSPGTYSVTVTNNNGCTGTASVNVGTSPQPSVLFSAAPEVCAGNCLSLNVVFTGVAPFSLTYTSSVTGQQVQTFPANTGSLQICPPVGTPPGSVTVTAVSVSDANCNCQ